MPNDVVRDVPFKVLDLGSPTFEECVKNNFLRKSVSERVNNYKNGEAKMNHFGGHDHRILVAQEPDGAADVEHVLRRHACKNIKCSL